MAKLRIFVSSTCYDLEILRSELRPFITELGYEPVMSEYGDVLFDPRTHTHESCLKEVPSCDMVLLIVGSRLGGTVVPSALATIDFSAMQRLSSESGLLSSSALLSSKEHLSITQAEVITAVNQGIPMYAFVDERVLHDHHVYECNKDKKELIDQIDFPSIQKRETARYIFEFINFLKHQGNNNAVISFSNLDEIRHHLLSQWSQLFQRLLYESRTRNREARRYADFSERIDDLKALVLATVATPALRDTARSALEFRHLISFLSALRFDDQRAALLSDVRWPDILALAHIVRVEAAGEGESLEIFLVRDDDTFFRTRYETRALKDFETAWEGFRKLDLKVREAIVDALLTANRRPIGMVKHVHKKFEDFVLERTQNEIKEREAAAQRMAQIEAIRARLEHELEATRAAAAEKLKDHNAQIEAPPAVG